MNKNAIIGETNSECEVISALVNPNEPEEMVYVAILDVIPDRIETLWYYPPQLVLKASDTSTANLPADELPCTLQQIREMQQLGYQWHGMLPINKNLAIELFREGVTVYLLYADGSESEIVGETELEAVTIGVMYGVTVEDWLICCGRLRDGEVVHYQVNEEPFEPIPISTGKFRGITKESGEEIEGFLLRCEGRINPGSAYICPGATFSRFGECRDSNGKEQYTLGPFIEVLKDSVVPVNIISDELLAYRRTGLKPSEIQEAVDLFKGADKDVPNEIIGWVNRAVFHNRKCAELTKEVERLEQENAMLRLREAKSLKEQLIERLARENANEISQIFTAAEDDDAVKNIAVSASGHIALCNAIVSVFMDVDLQYLQCAGLSRIPENQSILRGILNVLRKKEKVCYGENEVKDAVFEYIHEKY